MRTFTRSWQSPRALRWPCCSPCRPARSIDEYTFPAATPRTDPCKITDFEIPPTDEEDFCENISYFSDSKSTFPLYIYIAKLYTNRRCSVDCIHIKLRDHVNINVKVNLKAKSTSLTTAEITNLYLNRFHLHSF